MLRESLEEHWVRQYSDHVFCAHWVKCLVFLLKLLEWMIKVCFHMMILSYFISYHHPFWSDLYPPLRCPVHSHLTSLDGPVPDLCESVLRGQCALLAPSSTHSWAAVGPSGRCAAAGLDHPACHPLFLATWKGILLIVCVGEVVNDRMFPLLFKLWGHWWIMCVYLQVSEGLVLRDGTRLKYPINGIVGSCFVVVFCQTSHVILSHVWNIPVYCMCHPEPQSSGLQQLKTLFTAAHGRLLSSVS